jgi:hypothetical protein
VNSDAHKKRRKAWDEEQQGQNTKHDQSGSDSAAAQLPSSPLLSFPDDTNEPDDAETGSLPSGPNVLDDDDDFESSHTPMDDADNVQDWLLRLGKERSLGRAPIDFEDMKLNAGFPEDSPAPAYYWNEYQKTGQGLKCLIARAHEVDDPSKISDGEAEFALVLCDLLQRLTDEERELLAKCMQYAFNATTKSSVFQATNCPLTLDDFRRCYLNKKNAIIPNLPHPVTHMTSDRTHSYTTLTDVIANMLAAATPVEDFANIAIAADKQSGPTLARKNTKISVSSTPAAVDLYKELTAGQESMGDPSNNDEFVLYLWYKEWRDDFDPFNTKKSRNQVWAYTNTICPPALERHGRNTFYMALAGKGDDHFEVEQIFADELKKLSTVGMYAYHGGLKKIIKVKVGRLLNCVDRPEKTSMFRMGDHNGGWSVAFGYATKVDGRCKDNHLPACSRCRKARLQQYLEPQKELLTAGHDGDTCPFCSNWELTKLTSTASAFKYPKFYDDSAEAPDPPPGRAIPATIDGDQNLRLQAIKLSLEWCKKAVKFAHHNYKTLRPGTRSKFWTKTHFDEYLRTCGLSVTKLAYIFESAKALEELFNIPPTWDKEDRLMRTHYAPMHTLFLGIIKRICIVMCLWYGSQGFRAPFGAQANKILEELQLLRIRKFFDAIPFSTPQTGTGVWVAENYACWARIMKFFLLLPVFDAKVTSATPAAQEFKVLVRHVMACQVAIARIMSPKRTEADLDLAVKVFLDTMFEMDQLMDSMLAANVESLQKDDIEDINGIIGDNEGNIERTAEDADAANQDAAENPQTVSAEANQDSTVMDAYASANPRGGQEGSNKRRKTGTAPKGKRTNNFGNKPKTTFNNSVSLNLLQASFAHWYFGPAILNWEGGNEGEKKIKEAKPLMSVMRSNAKWQKIAHVKCLRQDSLKLLGSKASISREHEGSLKIYQRYEEFIHALDKNKPLSAVLDENGDLWAACRPTGISNTNSRSDIMLLKIDFQDQEGELVKNLCWCAPIKHNANSEKPIFKSRHALDETVSEYVLLLPRLASDGGRYGDKNLRYINSYYAVGSNWTERAQSGEFRSPDLNKDVFNDWIVDASNNNDLSNNNPVETSAVQEADTMLI